MSNFMEHKLRFGLVSLREVNFYRNWIYWIYGMIFLNFTHSWLQPFPLFLLRFLSPAFSMVWHISCDAKMRFSYFEHFWHFYPACWGRLPLIRTLLQWCGEKIARKFPSCRENDQTLDFLPPALKTQDGKFQSYSNFFKFYPKLFTGCDNEKWILVVLWSF